MIHFYLTTDPYNRGTSSRINFGRSFAYDRPDYFYGINLHVSNKFFFQLGIIVK